MPRIIEEVRYEGYGPGGVALIVEALTDNRNRTGRRRPRRRSPNMAARWARPNSVTFMFDRVGVDHLSEGQRQRAMPCWKRPSRPAPTNASRPSEATNSSAGLEDFGAVRDALEAKLGPAQSRQDRLAAARPRCR